MNISIKRKRSFFSLMVELALIDGELSALERQQLIDNASGYHVTPEEVKVLLTGEEDSIEFVPPGSNEEQFELLYDLVKIMMTDGFIHAQEMRFCKEIGQRIGFKPYVCDAIVPAMVTYAMNNASAEVASKAIMDPSYWPEKIRVSGHS